jgi:hypothetical protein
MQLYSLMWVSVMAEGVHLLCWHELGQVLTRLAVLCTLPDVFAG